MSADDFCEAGEGLFGPDWRKPLALALHISPVTVWRYANGLAAIPYTVELALTALRVERALSGLSRAK